MEQRNIIEEILAERIFQDQKWGVQHHTHFEWLSIFVEEVGEVSRAICECYLQHHPEKLKELKKELIQCAAVVVAWMEDNF